MQSCMAYWVLTITALLSLCNAAVAGSTGYLQIECNTSAEVYLDGAKVGSTSSDQASLIVEAGAGRHNVEVRKSGFQTQSFSIEVEAAKVKQVKVAPFQRTVQIGESGAADEKSMEQTVGSFKFQTVPVECSIDVPQLALTNQSKSKADWYVKDIPVGVYLVSLTADVPVRDSASGNVRMEHKTHRVQVPVASGRETYLLVNLITGEVKDIPAEQLVAKARERAAIAEKTGSIDEWRAVIQFTEQALATCQIEPAGAKELRDHARGIVQEVEGHAQARSERIKALEDAIRIARESETAYSSTKSGHGRQSYTLKFSYMTFANPLAPRSADAEIHITLNLGDALTTPVNALLEDDNGNDDLRVVAQGSQTSVWSPNAVRVYVYNLAAARVREQLEKELEALKTGSK